MTELAVILVLTLITAPDKQDIILRRTEPTIETCWADAKEMVEHGIPTSMKDDIQGVMAACLVHPSPTYDL